MYILLQKKVGGMLHSGCWEGFKWIDSDVRMERAWFQVRRRNKQSCCWKVVGLIGSHQDMTSCTITGFQGKSTLTITDFEGHLLAEVNYY